LTTHGTLKSSYYSNVILQLKSSDAAPDESTYSSARPR